MAHTLTDTEILARLVAFDSTSGNSVGPIAGFVEEMLGGVFETTRVPSDTDSRFNLIALAGPRGDPESIRSGLLFSGHMDAVPAREPEWNSDPFTLKDAGDQFIGRGACDMKGFIALALGLARTLDVRALRRPLAILLTHDEELGSLGAKSFMESWPADAPLPRNVIVGEPTSLKVVRMHKGHLKMRIIVRGRSAHSGYPGLGINAIEPAARIVGALADLRQQMERERVETSRFFPEAPFVILNVARIAGGEALNIVPEKCVVELGVRLLPGMESAPMIERIRAAAMAAAPGGACTVEVINDNPPMLLGEDALACREMCGMVGQRETLAAGYASDAGILQSMGMECVLWGPGSMEVAHKPNEWIPKAEFAKAGEMLTAIVRRFCVD